MRERDLFIEALQKERSGERAAYLDAACAGDDELLRRVERLLEEHQRQESFILDAPPPAFAGTVVQPPVEVPGTRVGPYKLLEQIGEGGMGVVFMAEQHEPVRRKVALKVIKPGMDTRQVIARFEAERQALAVMDHPHIAKVLDAGETASGRPFFVMELVRGLAITDYCDQAHLTPRDRLELFVGVCQAVQHAHQKGIIHRDLKPSNVLVAVHDGQPAIKVIDFGVAKATGGQLTDKTLFTGFAQMLGTPLYMSPEQAGQSPDIDTRSDIYSLGVLLYELLTGSTPFDKERFREAAYDEIRRIIREEEPPKPSTRLESSRHTPSAVALNSSDRVPADGTRSVPATSLASIAAVRSTEPAKLTKLVRGDLDWIVMKALEKDRNRRYETANGFAADVLRYLHDEPVQACPPSAGYRFRKFARRNKAGLAFAGLVLLFIVLLGVGVGWTIRERAGRQTSLRREVTRALEETETSYRRDKLPEAMASVKQAEGLLAGGGGTEDLRERVRQWRSDLEMATRLDEIRLEQAAVKDEAFDSPGGDPAYRKAFQDYGLDVEALAPDDAAARIKASAVKDALTSALDDWVLTTGAADIPGRQQLLNLACKVDSDAWRNRFRQAIVRRELNVNLAREKEVLAQPPTTLRLLGEVLGGNGQIPVAVEVLRRAQQRHPDDFWINPDYSSRRE